jgi:hypothetical protein
MARIMSGVTVADAAHGLDVEKTIRFHAVAAKVRERREDRGESVKEAAGHLRVPQYRVRAIEDGHIREVDPGILVSYTAYLGLETWLARWKRANRTLAQGLGLGR